MSNSSDEEYHSAPEGEQPSSKENVSESVSDQDINKKTTSSIKSNVRDYQTMGYGCSGI